MTASIFDNKQPGGKHFPDILQDGLELSTYKVRLVSSSAFIYRGTSLTTLMTLTMIFLEIRGAAQGADGVWVAREDIGDGWRLHPRTYFHVFRSLAWRRLYETAAGVYLCVPHRRCWLDGAGSRICFIFFCDLRCDASGVALPPLRRLRRVSEHCDAFCNSRSAWRTLSVYPDTGYSSNLLNLNR